MSGKATARKPQFIIVLPTAFMEKMVRRLLLLILLLTLFSFTGMASLYPFIVLLQIIPASFVQQHIPKEHRNNCMAIVLGPNGKVYNIKLETDRSDMFFTGGWSQFMVFHDITESNALLIRYEGNMVFTVKVFGSDGFQRDSKQKENRVQQSEQVIHNFIIF